KSVKDIPGEVDIAVFAIPASLVAGALTECGEKKVVGAILIPSGYAETGNMKGQEEIQAIGQKYGIRLMGPNIYGFYYTHANLCATFCTAYDVKGIVEAVDVLYPRQSVRDVLHRLRRQGFGGAVVTIRRHRHGDHRLLALRQDGRLGDRRP